MVHLRLRSSNNVESATTPSQPAEPTQPKALSHPTIELADITNDNLLNLAESQVVQTIKGKVANVASSNAKSGDVVKVTIGTTELTAQLKDDLSFEVNTSGQLLAQNNKVVVALATSDESGNMLTTSAEKAYEVDTVLNHPTITLDDITSGNVVNLAESQAEQTLKGKVANVAGSNAKSGDVVKVTIGTTELTAQLKDDLSFEVNTSGQLLAENRKIVASMVTTDIAENSLTTTYEKAYEVDKDISAPLLRIDAIAQDDIINAVEKRAETIMITGQAINEAEHAEAKVGDVVTLSVGQLQVSGRLNSELKFAIPVSTIALVNHKLVTASITSQDSALNSVSAEVSCPLTVDDTLNLSVSVNPFAEDNTVNKRESEGEITLSGRYTADSDVKSDTIRVSLFINNEERAAVVNTESQTWNLTLDGNTLARSEGQNQFSAKITAEDNAGNQAEANAEHTYQVDIVIGKPVVKITSIAEDDVIDLEEAKGSIKIKGIVEQSEGSNPVVLLCPCSACESGWKEVEATVVDGKFEVNVTVSETSLAKAKLKSSERIIKAKYTAKDTAGNEAVADEASRSYDVELPKPTEINITKIGNSFDISPSTMTRIYGKVEEFENITYSGRKFDWYNVGQNSRLILTATLVIGEKRYKVGFNGKNKTFQVDISNEDLIALAGKLISLNFDDDVNYNRDHTRLYGNLGTAIYSHAEKPVAKRFTLTGDQIEQNGANNYSLKAVSVEKTEISGTVTGELAKVGQAIEVKIGEQTFNTEVKEGNTFSIEVDSQVLKDNPSQMVTATLQETGNQVVTDKEFYVDANQVSGNFVSQHTEVARANRVTDHTSENYNFFYPIHLLELGGTPLRGFHSNYAVGGTESPLTIKYHFTLGNEINTIPRNQIIGAAYAREIIGFEQDTVLQNTFRQAYKVIEKFTNLKFEETSNYEEVINGKGSLITLAFLTDAHRAALAYAGSGSGIIWNRSVNGPTRSGTDFAFYTALHEITHTLNMVHMNEPFNAAGISLEASTAFSNMSYSPDSASIQMKELRLYDLAYLHYRFGVNRSHRAGNDVYTFKNYNGRSADGDVYIWDGNGIDTFDASNEQEGVTVNLTPGSWNYRGTEKNAHFLVKEVDTYDRAAYFNRPSNTTFTNGFAIGSEFTKSFNTYYEGQSFIGYGTQIENLIGSKFDDKLTGNNADNNIFGGSGNDEIAGGLGNDFINGGEGIDLMFGNEGNDTYVVDNVGDVVTELEDQGIDHIYSLINYELDENVENLTLIGITATEATGNELNNVIRANDAGNILKGLDGNDTLIGGLGVDTLTGGTGQDIFVFESTLNGNIDVITDFTVGEDKIKLDATIFGAIQSDLSNLNQHIFYDNTTGELSYNSSSTGADSATTFAVVANLGQVEPEQFIIG